jgi:hypothetical protein
VHQGWTAQPCCISIERLLFHALYKLYHVHNARIRLVLTLTINDPIVLVRCANGYTAIHLRQNIVLQLVERAAVVLKIAPIFKPERAIVFSVQLCELQAVFVDLSITVIVETVAANFSRSVARHSRGIANGSLPCTIRKTCHNRTRADT